MIERKTVKNWEKTRLQNLVRHKSGRYYARAFADGKEFWKALNEYSRLEKGNELNGASQTSVIKHSIWALRCTLLKMFLDEDYRGLSRRLAECPLFRWFCNLDELGPVWVPSKSTLQRYAHWLSV